MSLIRHIGSATLVLTVAAAPCAAFVAPGAALANEDHPTTAHDWGYVGAHDPRHWGTLKADYAACASGKQQSPIDIRGAVASDLDPIQFAYKASPLSIVDNGHSIQVNYAPGSSISIGGQLTQFHFHKPSEEKIDGKSFPMVAHFVHKSPDGKLAVVAVLMQHGKQNTFVQTLWNNLPKEKDKELTVDCVTIDATTFLPSNLAYYTFTGSLTTPPCSEGVTWFVLKTPVEVSDAQVTRFGKIYSKNARPVQPLNGRVIKVSK